MITLVCIVAALGPSVGLMFGAWWASRDKEAIFLRGVALGRDIERSGVEHGEAVEIAG